EFLLRRRAFEDGHESRHLKYLIRPGAETNQLQRASLFSDFHTRRYQFTQAATVDVGNATEIQNEIPYPLRELVPNGLPQHRHVLSHSQAAGQLQNNTRTILANVDDQAHIPSSLRLSILPPVVAKSYSEFRHTGATTSIYGFAVIRQLRVGRARNK